MAQTQEPGAELRVYLMTLGPGTLIYERFGHNAICIHDPNPSADWLARRDAFEAKLGVSVKPAPPFNTTDRAYHYGAFDFEQENFIWRFIHGRMQYWMTSEWADVTALLYAHDDRTVLLQELDLSAAQKMSLKEALDFNDRDENREYRYDYYRDNCSTRVRDAIDKAVGGELRRQLQTVPTGTTYRSHTRRLTAGLGPIDVFWFTAFTYVLGHPVDEPLSAWEECFLPERMADHVRAVKIPDGRGGTRPLVLSEHLMFDSTRPALPDVAPSRTFAYGIAGLLFGGVFAGLAWLATRGSSGDGPRARRSARLARWTFAAVIVPWCILWGLGATIGTYGFTVTDHTASYRNENLLQFSPLLLPLAVLGPMVALRRRRGARAALVLAVAGAGLSLLGLMLKVFPAFWQHNGEIIALALPANIGLAGAVLLLVRQARHDDAAASTHKPKGRSPT